MLRPRHNVYQSLTAGHYLTALRTLQSDTFSTEQTPWADDLLLWALNAVDPWGTAWSRSGPGGKAPDIDDLADPSGPIAAAFETSRVVIVMEAHRAPETRYFGVQLLHILRAAGASHFAFEAPLQRPLDRFTKTGIVRPDTEPYAFEPSRASLLRAARTLGFTLVAFDYPTEGYARSTFRRLMHHTPDAEAINRKRERDMAENIVRRILVPHPAARVVVWTGEQHAMKRTPPHWPWQHPFMAAHLAEIAGEEPFCVWQECVDLPALSAAPQILYGNHARLDELGVDAMVLHHRSSIPARPAWLVRTMEHVEVETAGAELIQMIPLREGRHATPAAQQLAHDAQRVSLSIPPDTYLMRGLSGSDVVVWQREIHL